MARFSYEPLQSSRAIRLIKFLPGPDPTCQIVTVEVEKAPPYIALSYTWGCKNLSRVILMNGAEIPITVNLAEAIDAIFIFVRERSMMFWADSICINQADVHERSRQVRLMNTIYRSAEMVAIWLGPAAHDSDLAFDKMKEWKARFDGLKEQFDGSEELAALRMICRRPWWKRAWIVQEGTIAN
ncbi:HET-domain-containing protein, partial [Byssothecium circinans]